MSSPAQIRAAAQRRMRLVYAFGIGLALLAGLTVATAMMGPDSGAGPSPASTTAPDPDTASVPPERWLALPVAGERIDDRFPTRFEHTPAGGIAMLTAMVEKGWGLDSAQMARAQQIYAAPWWRTQAVAKGQALVERLREFVGASPSGQSPAGAYVKARVLGAKWTGEGDELRAEIIIQLQGALGPDTEPQWQLFSTVAGLRWNRDVRHGDWVYQSTKGGPSPVAEPGTAEFNSGGWRAIQAPSE